MTDVWPPFFLFFPKHSFITGYWIWNKILENLASIGYDPVCFPLELSLPTEN